MQAPVQPHVNPKRAESVRTSEGQAQALRALFIVEDAQDWPSKVRSMWFKDILKSPAFNNLGLGNIKYQWNKFHGEFLIRRHIGAAFYSASKTMSEYFHVKEMIFSILAREAVTWSALPYPEFVIPTEYRLLMDKCVKYEASRAKAKGIRLDESVYFAVSDFDKIHSLIVFVRGL